MVPPSLTISKVVSSASRSRMIRHLCRPASNVSVGMRGAPSAGGGSVSASLLSRRGRSGNTRRLLPVKIFRPAGSGADHGLPVHWWTKRTSTWSAATSRTPPCDRGTPRLPDPLRPRRSNQRLPWDRRDHPVSIRSGPALSSAPSGGGRLERLKHDPFAIRQLQLQACSPPDRDSLLDVIHRQAQRFGERVTDNGYRLTCHWDDQV